MKKLLLAIIVLLPDVAFAQRPADFERVLLPVVLNGTTPGLYGALWITELWMYNGGNSPVDIRYPDCFVSACAPTFAVPPQTMLQPPIGRTIPTGARPGLLLWVPKEQATDVSFALRAQDLSRQSQTWGTEIPIVREEEFLTTTVQLLNVPMTDAFRQTLRIYEAESRAEADFLVRVVNQETNVPLATQVVRTVGHGDPSPDHGMPGAPGSAEIGGFRDVFALPQSVTRVRIEIAPLTPGIRFWAMMSVTNNETQHITIITPQ